MEPENQEKESIEHEVESSTTEPEETNQIVSVSKCFTLSKDEYFDGTYEEIDTDIYKNKDKEAYIYRKNNRWAIGPIANANQSWVFRNGHITTDSLYI